MDDENLFLVKDPLNRDVKLTQTRWDEHMKDHHDETDLELIKNNIENPRYILQNTKPEKDGSDILIIDQTRQDYIDLIPVKGKMHAIKTIVDFSNKDGGFIVTNYILRRANEIKLDGGVIYDSSKSKSSTEFFNI